MSAGLKDAMRLVETRGLAPLKRVRLNLPDAKARSAHWLAFNERLAEVNAAVVAELEAAGAVFKTHPMGDRSVAFAGVYASSSAGLFRVLERWHTAAQKRLIGGAK